MSVPLREHLIVFTRFPVPGKVKTRLIPELGDVAAAEAHQKLAELAVCRAISVRAKRNCSIEIRFEGGNQKRMQKWLGRHLRFATQGEGDLGQRMQRAMGQAFDGGADAVVIIGTDCPRLEEAILEQAFDALRERSTVFGPAVDGGYYLVGLSRPFPTLFDGIAWSTSRVLADSVRVALHGKRSPALLRTLPDVDVPADLPDWNLARTELERVSVIIPTLNESTHLGETLQRAMAASPHEIIVSDGGSADATLETARSFGARVISGPRGRAFQMNAGAKLATGELLLFLHADTFPPENYVRLIRQVLQSPENAAGAFRFLLQNPRPFGAALIERLVAMRCQWRKSPYGDQGIFMRHTLFEALGGFREWPILEDLDLVRRARKFGDIVTLGEAVFTSPRKWTRHGLIKMFMTHQFILLGHRLGIAPSRLAKWRM